MILLVKYKDVTLGSQTSVRAGSVDELKYQIFFRDNLKALLNLGHNAKSAKIKEQFQYAESMYQAQCDGSLTEDMLSDFRFETELGGFECMKSARTAAEIDDLISVILELTEARRKVNPATKLNVEKVVDLLTKARSGETPELIEAINRIHHIL